MNISEGASRREIAPMTSEIQLPLHVMLARDDPLRPSRKAHLFANSPPCHLPAPRGYGGVRCGVPILTRGPSWSPWSACGMSWADSPHARQLGAFALLSGSSCSRDWLRLGPGAPRGVSPSCGVTYPRRHSPDGRRRTSSLWGIMPGKSPRQSACPPELM